ncbi:MAG: hypothetical protein DRG39_07355 [Deltaproteobacteria bacterium]|nr:MAG: hypothetical protein DRG39_07355 [Deltaproteobacteria bacterium]
MLKIGEKWLFGAKLGRLYTSLMLRNIGWKVFTFGTFRLKRIIGYIFVFLRNINSSFGLIILYAGIGIA